MSKKKKKEPSLPAKRWLFHGILSDTPISPEDSYYSEEQIVNILIAPRIPGIKIHNFHLEELPQRSKKRVEIHEKPVENPASREENA